MTTLTAERVRELLDYDPETGVFRWRVASTHRARCYAYSVGDVAGHRHAQGYLAVWVDRRKYLLHRLAWLYVHGEMPRGDVDHANRCKTDNRIENLRVATRTQNNGNTTLSKHNTSGIKGVRRHRGKWVAQISIDNRCRYLGIFADKEDAAAAYRAAAVKHFGEFVRV